jgi:hypothetical protein
MQSDPQDATGATMERKNHWLAIIIVTVLLLVVSGSLFGYFRRHGMDKAQAYERGAPSLPAHVLVAAQGSAFKDRLVTTLAVQLEQRPAYVKVIDVGGLADVEAADWQAIVIVHSWEFGKPPRAVRDFVARSGTKEKIIDVTTSGSGREKFPGVDAISSASVMDEVPELVADIALKIDARLARQ